MNNVHIVDINGYKAELPIIKLSDTVSIAFFNLHGDPFLTEHCGKELAKFADGVDVIVTAESKGLQLAHVCARELNMPYYAVARKSQKLYMQDGIKISYGSSITTGKCQEFYLSKHDTDLLRGKNVGIVDDVISTGESLKGLEALVEKAGGKVVKKLFVLAEGAAADRNDVCYLAKIPLF